MKDRKKKINIQNRYNLYCMHFFQISNSVAGSQYHSPYKHASIKVKEIIIKTNTKEVSMIKCVRHY